MKVLNFNSISACTIIVKKEYFKKFFLRESCISKVMFKKILIFSFLVLTTNCSAPGSALLGPTFTGVKTGSVYQTSLSYGSSKTVNILKNSINMEIKKSNNLSLTENSLINKPTNSSKKPPILLALKTYKIEVSEVIDEEPLP